MQCLTPEYVKNPKFHGFGSKYIQVPCGRCYNCIISKANAWTGRIRTECNISDYCYFVTLTYEDTFLTFNSQTQPILVKSDIQKFLKRLRKNLINYKIKYYLVGEYGTKFLRPHYHAIFMFKKTEKLTEDDDKTLKETIFDSWNMGFTDVKQIHDNRIRYIVLYTNYKCKIPDTLVKPFSLISKGIGKDISKSYLNYLHNHLDDRFLSIKGVKYPLSRYVKEKIYTQEEKELYNCTHKFNFDESKVYDNYKMSQFLINTKLFKNKRK